MWLSSDCCVITPLIALVQGVTELFPVSSLGHSVLLPAWIGGGWQTMVAQSSQADSGSSFYLAYIVALHCATALALLWFFRADWARIIRGFFSSIRDRRVETSGQRLAWMIVLGTIPVGVTGIALEHTFRTLFAKPTAAPKRPVQCPKVGAGEPAGSADRGLAQERHVVHALNDADRVPRRAQEFR
jgi:undecaprenyl pyrophosphate phosphatase UppP